MSHGKSDAELIEDAQHSVFLHRAAAHLVSTLYEGDHKLPIVARLRASERQQLDDLGNLYVFSSSTAGRAPLRQIAALDYASQTAKILRRNHVRTITVGRSPWRACCPARRWRRSSPSWRRSRRPCRPATSSPSAGSRRSPSAWIVRWEASPSAGGAHAPPS